MTPVSFIYMNMFLDCAFVSLLGIENRSEFTSGNSFQLAIAIYLYDSMGKNVLLPHVAWFLIVCTQVIILNPQGI